MTVRRNVIQDSTLSSPSVAAEITLCTRDAARKSWVQEIVQLLEQYHGRELQGGRYVQ